MYPVLHPDDCWFGTLNDKQYFFFFFFLFVITILHCLHLGRSWRRGERVFIAFPYLCHNVSVFMNQFTIVFCGGGGTQQESYLTGSEEGS